MFKRTRYQRGSVEREEQKKGPSVWVYRWWEEDINGKAGASQGTGWGCQEIPDRICGALSSRRSSANHKRSLRTQEPAANHNQHALGALLSRGAASQSLIHTGCVHHLRKELDCPTLGQSAARTSQNCRGRALATGDRSCGWNQSQNQVCDVGFVFSRRSVGVLWPQSHIFRDTGREWRQARPEHRRTDQRQTSEIPLGFVIGTGQARFGRTGVSGSVARVSRRRLGYTSRRTWGATLAVMRFRQHEHQRPTLLLCRRGGNLKSTKTEASAKLLPMHPSLKHSLQEWRSQSLYNKPEDFVFPSERLRGSKPLDLACSPEKENSACFQTDRNQGCGLAHLSALGWNHAGGDGRAPTHKSETICGTATFMSRTNTCRRHRRRNAWHRTNWSTLFCRRVFCRRQT